MPVDVPTFRKYANVCQTVTNNYDGLVSKEKLRDVIGVEFDTASETIIGRHMSNIMRAGFFNAGLNGLCAIRINWVEFEDKIKKRQTELVKE